MPVLVEPAARALTRPPRRGVAALAAVLLLVAVGLLAARAVAPPPVRGAGAPAAAFSAARAYEHVRAVAAVPHPAGDPAGDAVLAYLTGRLRALGLTVEVQDTVAEQGGAPERTPAPNLARVRNVVAVLPGTAPTTRVFLVAHHDSVQTGPGGNDDAAGVATALETVRALAAGPRPRNDVVVVLTDAEEACLCGAQAFARRHPLAAGGGTVLNLEARGSRGPAVMFETSRRNAALVSAYAGTPRPVGTSFAVEVYRLLPNDTDLTPFLAAGFAGLNTAYIDGSAVYHTPGDTAAAVDRRSLQHHGDQALALARGLGGRAGAPTAAADATYFPLPGLLAHYPGSLTWPLAALAGLAVLALAVAARRRGLASTGRLLAGFALGVVPLVGAPAAARGGWAVAELLRPAYRAVPVDPYRPLWFRIAALAAAAAVLLLWYVVLRRAVGPAALAIGGLAWLAAIGAGLAAAAPGGSYLATVPALAGAVAGLAAVALRGSTAGPRRAAAAVLAVTAGGAVAVLVLVPTAVLLLPALGLRQAAAGGLIAVLLGLALLPVVDLLHPPAGGQVGLVALRSRRRGGLAALAALLLAVTATAAGLRADRPDAAHPVPTHLMYALDAGTGRAQWLTAEAHPQPWTAGYVTGTAHPVTADLPMLGAQPLTTGPAAAAPLPAPALVVSSGTRSGDTRTVRLRLTPQRPVRLVALFVAAGTTVTTATVAGHPVPPARPAGAGWGTGFVLHAPPPAGVDVELTVRGTGPLQVRATDASDGLTALPGWRPRPPDVGVLGSHTAEMLTVSRTYTL